MATITYEQTLVTVVCLCGMNYAIPEALNDRAIQVKGAQTLYCPLGHSWVYAGKTDAEKEREKRVQAERQASSLSARLDQERSARQAVERQLVAQKGETTKARKRASVAACPHPECKRTFTSQGMTRHIHSKHPGWTPEEGAPS